MPLSIAPDADVYQSAASLLMSWSGSPRARRARRNSFGLWQGRPVALLFRQIASPSYETLWFLRKAKRWGFEPVILEHRQDRFCAHNPYKRSLVTLPIVIGKDRHGRPIVRHARLAEHNSVEGRPFETIVTVAGESLMNYHHRRLAQVVGAEAPRIVDLSTLVPSACDGASCYYADVMKVLVDEVALFEDFVVDGQTSSFFERVVQPALRVGIDGTDARPQIVRLTSGHRANWKIWNWYPGQRDDFAPQARSPVAPVALAS